MRGGFKRTIHIFNPDTEYALASGRRHYTPPAHIVTLRRELALLPAVYANPEDCILLLDHPAGPLNQLKYASLCASKGLRILLPEEIKEGENASKESIGWHHDAYRFCPWGWNMSIRQQLLDVFGEDAPVPGVEEMSNLRSLAHRRTTIPMLEQLGTRLQLEIELPVEITDVETAMKAYTENPHRFFKAPWSSSGRGILLTDDLEPYHVEPWLRGIIRRQGSVIMEPAYDRAGDFATEWMCEKGTACFLGYSMFVTSRRGKYQHNIAADQSEIKGSIQKLINLDLDMVIQSQAEVIENIIAPYYNGPLGVDMLATSDRNLNPCVEVNLRYTMGMINLLYNCK